MQTLRKLIKKNGLDKMHRELKVKPKNKKDAASQFSAALEKNITFKTDIMYLMDLGFNAETLTDCNEFKESEAEVLLSEMRYRHLFENTR